MSPKKALPRKRVIPEYAKRAVLGHTDAPAKKLPPINRCERPSEPPDPRPVGRKPVKRVRRGPRPTQSEERTPRPTKSRHDGPKVRTVHIGEGLQPVPVLWLEVQNMTDVLLGRTSPPKEFGVLTLMEVADAYFARASEITMLIQAGERSGSVMKGSGHYKFRTGELRTFMEMCKRAHDLGSRRLTQEQLLFDQERTGRSAV